MNAILSRGLVTHEAQLLQALSATDSLGSAHCQRCRLDHLLDLTRGGQPKAQLVDDTIQAAVAAAAAAAAE